MPPNWHCGFDWLIIYSSRTSPILWSKERQLQNNDISISHGDIDCPCPVSEIHKNLDFLFWNKTEYLKTQYICYITFKSNAYQSIVVNQKFDIVHLGYCSLWFDKCWNWNKLMSLKLFQWHLCTILLAIQSKKASMQSNREKCADKLREWLFVLTFLCQYN